VRGERGEWKAPTHNRSTACVRDVKVWSTSRTLLPLPQKHDVGWPVGTSPAHPPRPAIGAGHGMQGPLSEMLVCGSQHLDFFVFLISWLAWLAWLGKDEARASSIVSAQSQCGQSFQDSHGPLHNHIQSPGCPLRARD
jgi:hypothetical protein